MLVEYCEIFYYYIDIVIHSPLLIKFYKHIISGHPSTSICCARLHLVYTVQGPSGFQGSGYRLCFNPSQVFGFRMTFKPSITHHPKYIIFPNLFLDKNPYEKRSPFSKVKMKVSLVQHKLPLNCNISVILPSQAAGREGILHSKQRGISPVYLSNSVSI